MALKLFSLFIVLIPTSIFAEYRVYQLQVSDNLDKPIRTITSTLDQQQYIEYYPLNKGEKITYIDSWMCWERGENFKPYCPSPNAPIKQKTLN